MQPIKGAKRRKSKGDVVYESPRPLKLQTKRVHFQSNERQWCSVTLPGRGEAWVEQHDVLASTKITPTPVRPSNFETIEITSMSDASMWSVASLLERIGGGTRKLRVLDYTSHGHVDEWIGEILTSCTSIDDVEFWEVPLGDLQVFVDHATANRFPLRRLALPYTGFLPRKIESFLDALSDPNHPLSMHLQELTLRLRTGVYDADDESEDDYDDGDDDEDMLDEEEFEDLLAPVVRMLDSNRTLRKVVLCFRLSGHEEESGKETIEGIFERFMDDDEEPWIPTGPLDEASTLAFLSVFHSENAVQRKIVDSNILATILQYAAPCAQREFNLEIRAEDSY